MLYMVAATWKEAFAFTAWGITEQSSGNYSCKVRTDVSENSHVTPQILSKNSAQIPLNDACTEQVPSSQLSLN